mgnify:CR=1 FL=1
MSQRLGSISNALTAVQENQKKIVAIAAALDKKINLSMTDQKELENTKRVQVKSKTKKVISAPTIRYVLHAIIPGRAWIEGPDRILHTVAKGDQLPGYGRVLSIDSSQGIIKTSSGIKISY